MQGPDLAHFECPDVGTVSDFMCALEGLRSRCEPEAWKALVKSNRIIRKWRYFLAQDPYTRWGLIKPRGYAGDASLMDFAYGHPSVLGDVETAGPLGRHIYQATTTAKQSASARLRIQLIRQTLMDFARRDASFSVISFASGHARELDGVGDDVRRKISCFTAIDQDSASLAEIERSVLGIHLNLINQNVLRCQEGVLKPADLVYSLGLFDYLSDEHAQLVLDKMLQVMNPGGVLMVANLAPDAANIGYCEAIMDWWMILRSLDDMRRLAAYVKRHASVSSVEIKREGCFYYLTAVTAS